VYPDTPPWRSDQLSSHLRVFPEGQFVAVQGPEERVVGMAACCIVFWDHYHLLDSWETFTAGGLLTNHDPVRGGPLPGGVSIIAGHATADHGQASRIVPRLEGPITDPRMDTQFIVTEYGVCDLRGKSTIERALGLIEIAHP
jgi:hypothetical protein